MPTEPLLVSRISTAQALTAWLPLAAPHLITVPVVRAPVPAQAKPTAAVQVPTQPAHPVHSLNHVSTSPNRFSRLKKLPLLGGVEFDPGFDGAFWVFGIGLEDDAIQAFCS